MQRTERVLFSTMRTGGSLIVSGCQRGTAERAGSGLHPGKRKCVREQICRRSEGAGISGRNPERKAVRQIRRRALDVQREG